jgi:hypothetical protein
MMDVADVTPADLKNNQIESTNGFYVISPSTAFDQDMSTNAGQISDLL